MAKKRVRRVVHRKVSKRTRRVVSNARRGSVNYTRTSSRKLKIVTSNLVLFVILGILSYLLYNSSTQLIYVNLFYLLSFLFGFVSLAFFIALLILLILRGMGR